MKKILKNIEGFLNLLDVPLIDRERFIAIIPTDIKRNEKATIASLNCRWVRNKLIACPGFLYDRMWAATLLGIKEKSFEKIERIFKGAKYNGIFMNEKEQQINERWWQSRIREVLYSKFPDSGSIYPWELGRMLPGINESDFSGCCIGENCPDTVAYINEISNKRVQVPLRDTIPHPGFEKFLFFEEIRMVIS